MQLRGTRPGGSSPASRGPAPLDLSGVAVRHDVRQPRRCAALESACREVRGERRDRPGSWTAAVPKRHVFAARRAALGCIVECALQRSAHSVSAGEKVVPKRHDFHGPVEHERAHPTRRSPRMRESCRPGSSEIILLIVSSGNQLSIF